MLLLEGLEEVEEEGVLLPPGALGEGGLGVGGQVDHGGVGRLEDGPNMAQSQIGATFQGAVKPRIIRGAVSKRS